MSESSYNHDRYNQLNQASLELIKTYFQALTSVANYNKAPDADIQEGFDIQQCFQNWFAELLRKPNRLWQAQSQFFEDYLQLCQHLQVKIQERDSLPKAHIHDKRFSNKSWQEDPFFYFIHQSYLLFAKHCLKFAEENPSHNAKLAKQIHFFVKNYLDALSPANFIFTNPEVIQQTLSSQGENLINGMKNYLNDWVEGEGHFSISMTDKNAFEIGKNVAVTPGKVIFQNEMMELIHYAPTTDQLYQTPLLIVPPWINKYYILDLQPRNSFVKWIVDQGYSVYMISWVNPDEHYQETDFKDYLKNGLLTAVDEIIKTAHVKQINALGFCIGGTLLGMAVAYMKQKQDKRIKSATFLTTLLDFADAGDIQSFIDDNQYKTLLDRIESEGYLDGRFLMNIFNLLRPNELMWPYYINNYLCGKQPYAFDILYWNCDSSNLPKQMVKYFIKNMYMDNRLANNALEIDQVPIKLNEVSIPSYFLSTENDHIAPWQSTYLGAQYFKSDVTFVLGGAGHIAGVLNPPIANKYYYRFNETDFHHFKTAESWYDTSSEVKGSWWVHWIAWLQKHSGDLVSSSKIYQHDFILKSAPGDYVKRRYHHR